MSRLEKYPKYKNSRVEWLGEIPEGWEVKPTKRFHENKKEINTKRNCDNVLSLTLRGVVNNNIDSPEGLVPKDYATYQIFEKDNLVFKLIDLENISTSRVGLVHEKGIMSSAYIRLKVGKSSLPRFAYYYFYNLYLNQVYNNLGSGVRSTLGPTDLLNILYIEPPKQEQQKIANYLDQKTAQIDKAITLKEQLIEKLKERRQVLINDAVTKGIDPNVRMKESGVEWIGEIPEHWTIKKNKYLFFEVDERSKDGSEELLSVSHMTGVTPRSEKNVNMFMSEDYTGSKTCSKDDLVINIMWAWMGAMGIADRTGIVSSSYGIYRQINQNTINTVYLEYLLKTNKYIEEYNKRSTGLHASRLRLYSDMFFDMKIGFAPFHEQRQIVEYIENQTSKINKTISLQQKQIEKLKEYKAILIDSVVTGKVKV